MVSDTDEKKNILMVFTYKRKARSSHKVKKSVQLMTSNSSSEQIIKIFSVVWKDETNQLAPKTRILLVSSQILDLHSKADVNCLTYVFHIVLVKILGGLPVFFFFKKTCLLKQFAWTNTNSRLVFVIDFLAT